MATKFTDKIKPNYITCRTDTEYYHIFLLCNMYLFSSACTIDRCHLHSVCYTYNASSSISLCCVMYSIVTWTDPSFAQMCVLNCMFKTVVCLTYFV
jgi:hypothetical protein